MFQYKLTICLDGTPVSGIAPYHPRMALASDSPTAGSLDQVALRFPCRLGRDPAGMPSGPEYIPCLRANYDNTQGTGWSVPCPKSGRTINALSMNEEALCYEAILDPEVLDLRDQYPILDRHRLRRYLEDPSLRIPRSLVPSFDLVLTRIDPSRPMGIKYQAISVKPLSDLGSPEVQRRFDREEHFCEAFGWEWRVFTDRERVDQRTHTARQIVRRLKDRDIESLRLRSLEIAPLIQRYAHEQRTLLEVSQLAAKSAKGLTPSGMLDLIAAAAIYGFIRLDLNRPLRKNSPLVLSGDSR